MKRRTQQYGQYSFTFKTRSLSVDFSRTIPQVFKFLIERLYNKGIFPYENEIFLTINEYDPGQGIMPHVDAAVRF